MQIIWFFVLCSLYAPESLGMPKADKEYNMYNNEVHNLQCSYLIVNPVKRKEIWRFVTYIFLHANHQHIGFNLLMQLLIGELNHFFLKSFGLLSNERIKNTWKVNDKKELF